MNMQGALEGLVDTKVDPCILYNSGYVLLHRYSWEAFMGCVHNMSV